MKKLLWVALAFALFAVPSHAQQTPAADVSAGYSYLRITGTGGLNMNGASGSVAYNANNWLGLVGDLGVYHGSSFGVGLTAVSYTFGPRLSYRSSYKFVPFAQALFGGSHFSALGASSNPFAFDFGGGVDLPLGSSDKVGLRPQFDYVGFRSNGVTTNSVRISVGIVFHFGER